MKSIISLVTFFLLLVVYPIVLLATSAANNDIQEANANLLKACMNSDSDNVEDVESALKEVWKVSLLFSILLLLSAPFSKLMTMIHVRKGADIDFKDKKTGHTPLLAATIRGKVQTVQFLLKAGANVSIGDKFGFTAPHLSALHGTADVMLALIEA